MHGDGSGGGVCVVAVCGSGGGSSGGGVYMCVLTRVCAWACMWRPEIDDGRLSPLLSTLLYETGTLSEIEAH